ncbi:PEP-CTERM/exosortase system-associated acyltransferase [Marinomonas sp. PE14-40]|uniref:PEP-CTERM/exosortase system-associated acyltransferase n=1 Tax=Marinomonas sp. PE14-40 TaxID=3060621 RepID=UPI003F67C33E
MTIKLVKKVARSSFMKPLVESVKKAVVAYKSDQLSQHFNQYLAPVAVQDSDELAVSQQLRHLVYCEEMNFLPLESDKTERDEMDHHAYHCLIQHTSSQDCAGTVRIVHSKDESDLLPIEVHCKELLAQCDIKPSDFPRDQLGEVSRLAVNPRFRRRKHDKYQGLATDTGIDVNRFTEKEMRTFPLIAVGLYLSAGNICRMNNIDHIFVMMEPKLAKKLSLLGFSLQQVGPKIQYHGMRAPFYCRVSDMAERMPVGFRKLYRHLGMELTEQLDHDHSKK